MKKLNIRKYMDKKNRMRFKYAKYLKSMPVDKSVILFESFHGKEISDSPFAMARALLDMQKEAAAGEKASSASSDRTAPDQLRLAERGYKLYFSTNDMERDEEALKKLGLEKDISLVHIHSDEYAKLLATAGLMINNSSFPSYIVRREGQTYLQTWHGTPWKTLGRSMKGELATMHNVQHNFIQASHILFPNEFTRDAIMRDYVLDDIYTGKVVLSGYPRNSVFSDREKAAEIKKLCGDENVRTLAYMPTWRGQDNRNIETDAYVDETVGLLKQIDEALADDQKLYVNLHPIVQSSLKLDGFRHISAFPKEVEKYEFINSMDALITDYSSVFFDYSVTGKPVILFTYDYENYASERGMYFGIEELPFDRANSIEELTGLLSSRRYESQDYAKDSSYGDRFIKYDRPDAARVLMEYMLAETENAGSGNTDGSRPSGPELSEEKGMVIEDRSFLSEKPWTVINCKDMPGSAEMDSLARETGENDLVVFHQSKFSSRAGDRLKELYDGNFPYVFTTEAVPQTEAEAMSRSSSVRAEVKQRNLTRQVGRMNVAKTVNYRAAGVELTGIKTSGSSIMLEMKAVKTGGIKDVVLEYRSGIEQIAHSMDVNTGGEAAGGGLPGSSAADAVNISASMDMSVLKHGCIYWDIYVTAEEDGEEQRWPVRLSQKMRKKLRRGYYQCELGEYIAFPHISLTHTLAFTNREKTRFDNRSTRAKEIAVPLVSAVWSRLNRKRRIWLVFEKFCSAAQDNGYYFFRYCMEQLPADKKKDIYFVIDKEAKDYENVKPYSDHVLQFMSFRHMLYAINAKVYVGSDSKKHLYAWRPKPNLISIRMGSKPIHFLQHGVTALKRSGVLFGANGSSPMTHVSTTSKFEQHIMDEYWGYSPANAPVLGFTRWDVLEDKSTPDEKMILVMPTWRAWLEEKPEEDFLKSDYFRNYMEMLADEDLMKCLEENDVKLIFFIHPKFRDYLGRFSAKSDRVELVQFGSRPLNEIMMKCHMLVTDYSSVCWDVYYMGKPVIFYQFDYDMYMENHGSYMDMEHELFGDRYTELSDVTRAIKECVESGFEESERAKRMRSRYFEYIDNDNSKRTYEYLKKQGY